MVVVCCVVCGAGKTERGKARLSTRCGWGKMVVFFLALAVFMVLAAIVYFLPTTFILRVVFVFRS